MAQGCLPIPTRLVGGFLGAGKTTFILEQLKSAGAKVAVLVNEFGKLGIDGDLIRLKGGIDVVEMPGGCICCSQKQGLLASILSIAREIGPELLLIEPSGVAEISELLQVLADPSLEGVIRVDAVITILDAETFLEFSEPEAFGLFFLDQVRSADLVLTNKSDLVTPQQLAEIEARVAFINPAALMVRTEFCRLEQPLPEARTRPVLESNQRTESEANQASEAQQRLAPEPRYLAVSAAGNPKLPGIDCLSVTPERAFSEEALALLLAELGRGRFGRIMRGKGFLELAGEGWINLQLVSGTVRREPLASASTARLTLIGFDLKAEELRDFLDGL